MTWPITTWEEELQTSLHAKLRQRPRQTSASFASRRHPMAQVLKPFELRSVLPITEGVDSDSIWTALALALREKQDPSPYLSVIRGYEDDESRRVLEFIAAIRGSESLIDEERRLDGLDATLRGHAYSAALVLLGSKAPEQWRRAANRLLFTPERPYFNDAPRVDMTQSALDEPGIKTHASAACVLSTLAAISYHLSFERSGIGSSRFQWVCMARKPRMVTPLLSWSTPIRTQSNR